MNIKLLRAYVIKGPPVPLPANLKWEVRHCCGEDSQIVFKQEGWLDYTSSLYYSKEAFYLKPEAERLKIIQEKFAAARSWRTRI